MILFRFTGQFEIRSCFLLISLDSGVSLDLWTLNSDTKKSKIRFLVNDSLTSIYLTWIKNVWMKSFIYSLKCIYVFWTILNHYISRLYIPCCFFSDLLASNFLIRHIHVFLSSKNDWNQYFGKNNDDPMFTNI